MTYTNSFHHGTEVVPGHNRRSIRGEAHIDPNGHFEIWKDEKLADAYDRIFGEALQEYNAKQKRADRKIKSYLQNVRQNSKLNDCYEFIAQVGNEKSHPNEKLCHDILKAYYEGFCERNPGLEVFGAYFHADEVGGCPHIHMDYIPTAQNKKTGLKLKNNLTEALKKLGYETEYVEDKERGVNKKTGKPYVRMLTAEMKFQEAERKALTDICRDFGIEIENPKRSPNEYCSSQQLRQARDIRMQNDAREEELKIREAEAEAVLKSVAEAQDLQQKIQEEKDLWENTSKAEAERTAEAILKEKPIKPLKSIEKFNDIGSAEKLETHYPIKKNGLKKENHFQYADRMIKTVWDFFSQKVYEPLKERCEKLVQTVKDLKRDNELKAHRIEHLEAENRNLNANIDQIVEERLKDRSEMLIEATRKPLQDEIQQLQGFIYTSASFKHSKKGHEIVAKKGLLDMAERCDNWRRFSAQDLRHFADEYDRYNVKDNYELQEAHKSEKARKIKAKEEDYGMDWD